MKNLDIRAAAKAAGVKLWEIGDELGLTDFNFSRKLRYELKPDEKQVIFQIIEKLKTEKDDSMNVE